MARLVVRSGCALALLLGAAALTHAQDTKSGTATKPEPAPKAPNWSGYVAMPDIVGEVVKADDKSVTVKVTWVGQAGPARGRPQMKKQQKEYTIDFVPESLVRLKARPKKVDDKGKPVPLTAAEYNEARSPAGVVGYAASKGDLVPGVMVDIQVVRDKTVPAAKATEGDLRVKYAIIQNDIVNPLTPVDPPAEKKKP